LATSKKVFDDGSEHIVIWFSNLGTKSIRGVQFELFMLDGVGNRYPASQRYVATADFPPFIKPNTGDVVDYPTDAEKQHFGADWQNIAGVEVRVTRVMFKDNSVWIPAKGQFCKAVFMNGDYDSALKKWQDAVDKKLEQEKKKANGQPQK